MVVIVDMSDCQPYNTNILLITRRLMTMKKQMKRVYVGVGLYGRVR